MANYCVFRSDLMSGTDVAADLVSCKVYSGNTEIAVENGTIVVLGEYVTGEKNIFKATLATATSDLSKCVVIGSPEVMYDERNKNLSDFRNEAGAVCRGYKLRNGNIYSVTGGEIADAEKPTVAGTALYLAADGKLSVTASTGSGDDLVSYTKLGELRCVESNSRYTYYVIQIA